MNTVLFEQIFYGRGDLGYAILGNSPGAANFKARVGVLCGDVGTPNNDYHGKPFLLSVPEKDSVIMICGRRGAPDSMGRETLFFQALIAEKSVLVNAKVDAFSLFSQGAFTDKMPSGDIAPLCIEVKSQKETSPRLNGFANLAMPCAIRSEKPLLDIVRAAVGDRALELSWATFAFQPMRSFDVQVIPPRAPYQRTVDEYDATGKLIRSAATGNSKESESLYKDLDKRSYPSHGPVSTGKPKGKSSTMFELSVAINILLAIVCIALFISRKSVLDAHPRSATPIVVTNTIEKIVEKQIPLKLSDAQRAEIENTAIKRSRSELEAKFPSVGKDVFLDFNRKASDLFKKYYGPDYDSYSEANKAEFKKQHEFLDKLGIGIDFVNKELLKGKPQ